ncbi:lipocalin family protein [Tenacibaculum agarivorans]|uniref:lipocalin family protein n=1 Tax=Tenacibaculum agarivorans TaxID=1908389 RepID=UPI00094B8980|nr:lipocalin family protein [Tenacibaculum agarivorans]
MKKILILSFAFLCLFSCSDTAEEAIDGAEDIIDDNTSDKDLLIGTWTLIKNNNNVDIDSDCQKKTTYEFKEDNSYTYTEFNVVNNNCTEITDNNQRGQWTNKGNSMYEIKRHGYTSGAVGEIKFSENNTNMNIGGFTYKRK